MSQKRFPPDGENRLHLERKKFSFKKYDPEPNRDYIRAGIASGLVVLLLGMISYASIQLTGATTKRGSSWRSSFRQSSVF